MRNRTIFYLILIGYIDIFNACQPVVRNIDFLKVLGKAEQENKRIWMILGENAECKPCDCIIQEMEQQHIFFDFDSSYIFYVCNLNKPENQYLRYIFLIESLPHFFILEVNGEIKGFKFNGITAQDIRYTLEKVRKNDYACRERNINFQTSGDELLELQNDLLKAHLFLQQFPEDTNRLKEALKWIEKSITIEPYFYNLYCASRINRILGDQNTADSCALLALKYGYEEYTSAVYQDLITELKKETKTLSPLQPAEIKFDNCEGKDQNVALGDSLVFIFEFQNLAEEPLRVISVSSSCSCAHPKWNKQPVKKEEAGKIEITYYAKSKGYFNRTFQVYSNSSVPITSLTISGHVK